jgi:Histone methylation protein DOT1
MRVDLHELAWMQTWAKAFPSLLPVLFPNSDVLWQRLAWKTLWDEFRSHASTDKESTDSCVSTKVEGVTGWSESLGYGEISSEAVWHVLHLIRNQLPRTDAVMVDLGSGNGKVLLAAALGHTFGQLMGIEIRLHLHNEALAFQRHWDQWGMELECPRSTVFDFRCADFTIDTDWIQKADLVFCHATVFEPKLREVLQSCCEKMPVGTLFCMISEPLLDNEYIETMMELCLPMSWGEGRVFLQRRGRQRSPVDSWTFDHTEVAVHALPNKRPP